MNVQYQLCSLAFFDSYELKARVKIFKVEEGMTDAQVAAASCVCPSIVIEVVNSEMSPTCDFIGRLHDNLKIFMRNVELDEPLGTRSNERRT